MRVLYFSRDYTTHDRLFLSKLSESEHELHYLRLESDGTAYDRRSLPPRVSAVEWRGGRGPAPRPADWLALMPDLVEVLESLRPDLVHAGPIPSCGFMAALAGARPLLLQSWGSDVLRDPEGEPLARFALRRSDMLFCDSDAVRDKVRGWLPYPDERVVQLPWGTDPRRFCPGPDVLEARKRPGWEGAVIVLSLRSWEEVYDIETVVLGLSLARRAEPRLRLILAGDGSRAPVIERLIAREGLQDAVWRPGRVPHERLQDYYRGADVYAAASLSDGSSVSLLEAMATGLPAVVTDIPGNREWVQPGVNGELFPPGDAEALGRALAGLAADATARRRLGEAGLALARQRADLERNFPRLLDAYRRLKP